MCPRYRSADGYELAFTAEGSGPPLVLIHGWGADGTEWAEYGWVEVLQQSHRLLIPDLRGHGQSDKPHDRAAYPMPTLASDVICLLDHVGTATADVLGYSLGGAIALWMVAGWPERVNRLVAGGIAGSDPEGTRALGAALRAGGRLFPRAQAYRDYALGRPGNDLVALAACLESGLLVPPCAELAGWTGPALFAAGDADRRFGHTQRLASCVAGSQFVALTGADHVAGFGDPRFQAAAQRVLEQQR